MFIHISKRIRKENILLFSNGTRIEQYLQKPHILLVFDLFVCTYKDMIACNM